MSNEHDVQQTPKLSSRPLDTNDGRGSRRSSRCEERRRLPGHSRRLWIVFALVAQHSGKSSPLKKRRSPPLSAYILTGL